MQKHRMDGMLLASTIFFSLAIALSYALVLLNAVRSLLAATSDAVGIL